MSEPTPENWEERLRASEVRLRAWQLAFERAFARLRRERLGRRFVRSYTQAELLPIVEQARIEAGADVLAEMTELFDAIADRYPIVLPQERARMRARIGSEEKVFELFWDYIEAGPRFVRATPDASTLRRALCAVSIHDLRKDIELVDTVLGELVLAAAAKGIDWRDEIAAVARVSNLGTGGGGAHMREHLEGFEHSDWFKRAVQPRLKDAVRQANAQHIEQDSSAAFAARRSGA